MSIENLNEIKKNFFLTFSRQLVGLVFNVLSSVILARYLKQEGFGEYTLVIVYSNLIVQFISFGVNTSNVYFLAKKTSINNIFFNSIIFTFVVSAIAALPGYLLLNQFTDFELNEIITCLVIIPVVLLNLILNSLFQGLQDFKRFNISMLSFTIILVVLQLILVLLKGRLIDFLYAFILSNILSAILAIVLLRKYATFNWNYFDPRILRSQISFGVKNYLSNILTYINYRGDMIIMEKFLSPKAVGIYNVSVTLAEKIWMVSTTLSTALYPKLSEISDKKEESRLIVITLSKITLILNLLACLTITLIAEKLILWLYGQEYIESVTALLILLPGICATSVARIFSNYISSINKPLYNFYISIITVVLNITLNILLIPKYFILGAAITTTFVYCLNLIAKSVVFYKFSGATPKEIFWNKIDARLFKMLKK